MSTNKDQVKGRIKEAEGKIKEVAGKLVGNEKLEAKGKTQKVLGKAQAKFGDVKQDVKNEQACVTFAEGLSGPTQDRRTRCLAHLV